MNILAISLTMSVITDTAGSEKYHLWMPWGLRRFQETGQVHFITFSCYRRRPKLQREQACATFVSALERVRRNMGCACMDTL
jgi:hypothetical protein